MPNIAIKDVGIWDVLVGDNGNIVISSTDFTYDASIHITGDFASDEIKSEYASQIANRLNRTIPE